MVSEKKTFSVFPHYKCMETLDPCAGASLDPRGLVGRITVEATRNNYITQHIICGPHGFRED